MNTPNSKLRTYRTSLPLALLFISAAVMVTEARAHQVIGANGQPTHTHVYKKAPYGNGVVVGHAAKPSGSNGLVIWQSAPQQAYGRAQSGMSISRDPWAKKNPKLDQKQMYKQKPAFSKNQSRSPDLNPK